MLTSTIAMLDRYVLRPGILHRQGLINSLFFVMLMLAAAAPASAQTVTWTGAGDGVTWSLPANWSSSPLVPGSNDDVVIPAGFAGVTFSSGGAVQVRTLSVASPLTISAQTLSVLGDVTLVGGARVTLQSAGVLNFAGGAPVMSGNGEVRFVGVTASTLRLSAATTLTVGPGVTVRTNPAAAARGVISMLPIGQTPATLVNQGTISSPAASSELTFSGTGLLQNTGTVRADNGGVVVLGVPSQNNGMYVATTNGTIRVLSSATLGQILRTTGGRIMLGGTITGSIGPASDGQPLTAENNTTFVGVTLYAPVLLQSSQLVVTGGLTLLGSGSVNLSGSSLEFRGGTQTVAGNGTIITTGNSSLLSDMLLTEGVQLTIDPAVMIATASNAGNLRVFFRGPSLVQPRLVNRGSVHASGLGKRVVLSNDGGAIGTFSNTGSIGADGGSILQVEVNWENSGQVGVGTGGTLLLAGEYTMTGQLTPAIGSTLRLGGRAINAQLGPLPAGTLFQIDAGTILDGATINAPTVVAYGTTEVRHGLNFVGGASLALTHGTSLLFTGGAQSLAGNGLITVGPTSSAASVQIAGGCVLTVEPGVALRTLGPGAGTVDFLVDVGSQGTSPAGLINGGTLSAAGPSHKLRVESTTGLGTFTNNGVTRAEAGGSIELSAPRINTGQYQADSAGTVYLRGTYSTVGPFTRTAGGKLKLGGTFANGALAIPSDGLPYEVENGVNFTNVAIAGTMLLDEQSVNVRSGLTLAPGTVVTMKSYGNFLFRGGVQLLGGLGELVSISDGASSTIAALDGADVTIGDGIVIRTSPPPGATRGDIAFTMNSATGPARITNNGAIRITGDVFTFRFEGDSRSQFVNAGELLIDRLVDGDITVSAFTNRGTMIFGPGCDVRVPGQGFLTTVTFADEGTVINRIRAAAQGSGGAFRSFSGIVTLGGRAELQLVDGFSPAFCGLQQFIVTIPPATISGRFGDVVAPPATGSGLKAAIVYPAARASVAFTSIADVAALGGSVGPDTALSADDIVVFLEAFFVGNAPIADVASLGGGFGADGQMTADDLIQFLQSYFAGCP
ncbi:MAG: GC-type dockerin domain-anchored protein [Phycisphaerales bacterium]